MHQTQGNVLRQELKFIYLRKRRKEEEKGGERKKGSKGEIPSTGRERKCETKLEEVEKSRSQQTGQTSLLGGAEEWTVV